ncbi:hypothetical protein Tsubulata_010193 [Turnera subulata]|uniref:DUF506 family protein n=1 Tax=Turnera subulata TaxID=218843 RepID=A0A9Q0FI38_9ROSI|nr:hypothetical protein Tsubulata_010193 [Turnera subulata]
MGSLGEEELVQMVRDYIESSESFTSIPFVSPKHPVDPEPQPSLQDILSEATAYETEVLNKVMMYVRKMGEASSLKKWVVMRLRMDGYEASLCKSHWVSTFDRRVMQFSDEYEYIDVMKVEKNKHGSRGGRSCSRLIVDMDFRSQFEVARPTQAYKDLISTLPSVFVGTEERLEKTVSLLCSAAKQSLKEKGLHVPPWRKAKYMHSKWLSKNCKKVSVWPDPEILDHSTDDDEQRRGSSICCPSIF